MRDNNQEMKVEVKQENDCLHVIWSTLIKEEKILSVPFDIDSFLDLIHEANPSICKDDVLCIIGIEPQTLIPLICRLPLKVTEEYKELVDMTIELCKSKRGVCLASDLGIL